MNAIDAAEKVLAEAGRPLSYREITRGVLEAGGKGLIIGVRRTAYELIELG